jgi:putative phosphoesterase
MGKHTIYIIHDLATVDLDLKAAGIDIVIFGHSHQPTRFTRGPITFINPGSAGPERLRKPISMAILRLRQDQITTDFIEL